MGFKGDQPTGAHEVVGVFVANADVELATNFHQKKKYQTVLHQTATPLLAPLLGRCAPCAGDKVLFGRGYGQSGCCSQSGCVFVLVHMLKNLVYLP